jgi:hypothetical protein
MQTNIRVFDRARCSVPPLLWIIIKMKANKPDPRYTTRAAADSLIAKFGWTCKDWMQDWPLEISNEVQIDDCIQEYERLTDEDEKFLLMKAILYALDEVTADEDFKYYNNQVSNLLIKDFNLHEFTVYYWTLYENPEFEGFRITPSMRQIWNKTK